MKHLLTILFLGLCSVIVPQQLLGQVDHDCSQEEKDFGLFSSVNERKASLAIPNDLLKEIKTSKLLDVCLDYPYLLDFFAYDSSEDGFNALISDFNGFKELNQRADRQSSLIEEIKQVIETLSFKRDDIEDIGSYTLRCCVLLNLLEQTLNPNNMHNEQRQQVLDVINDLSTIDAIQESVSINVINHILQSLDAAYVSAYFNDGYYSLEERYTPNGYTVYVYKRTSSDYSSSEIRSQRNYFNANYSCISILGDPSKKYNCHAYAWHMCQGNSDDKVWIGCYWQPNPPSIPDTYWETGSYYEVDESEATIVTYMRNGEITHSAIRINSNEYLSKWGSGPLIHHTPGNVPSGYGTPYKYYKRYNTPSLNGPNFFSSSQTYSLSNLPSGYSVTWSFSESDKLSSFNVNYPNNGQCTLTRNQSYNIYEGNLSADIRFAGYNVHSVSKCISSYTGFYGKYRINGGHQTQISSYPYIINYTPNCLLELSSPNLIGATVSTQGDAVTTSWNFDQINGCIRVGMPSHGTLVITINSSNGTFNIPVLLSSGSHSISVGQENGNIIVSIPNIEIDDNTAINIGNINNDYVLIQRLDNGEVLLYQPLDKNSDKIVCPVNGRSGIYLIKTSYNGNETVSKIAVF